MKRIKTIPFIVETTGGIGNMGLRQCHVLARRSRGKNAIDRTVYGDTRVSTRSFVKHHTQQISKTAVQLDAQNIRAQITSLKQKAVDVANAAASATAA